MSYLCNVSYFSETGDNSVYREDYVSSRLTPEELERYKKLNLNDQVTVCYLMTGGASFEKAVTLLPLYNREP